MSDSPVPVAAAARPASPLMGEMRGWVHHFPIRVYFEDTDAGAIVYHANYLKYAERARTEFMRLLGVSHGERMVARGLVFVIAHMTLDFQAPARLDDVLDVRTWVTGVRNSAMTAVQQVWRAAAEGEEARQLVAIDLRAVCVNDSGRPSRMPEDVRDTLIAYTVESGSGPAGEPAGSA